MATSTLPVDSEEEETQLERHIQTRLRGRVCGLRVLRRDDSIVLQGQTRTYYAKQLVLHTAMCATDLPIVAGGIEVVYADKKRHESCDLENFRTQRN